MNDAAEPLKTTVPGYDFGSLASAQSPISLEDLGHLEQTLGWTREDEERLRRHSELFRSQAERMVDTWRAVIAAQPHLSRWFAAPDGKPDDAYKAAVRRRFVLWVVDVATRPHDQTWLNYQEEIGLRHTPEKKNKTDGSHTPPFVPLRYLLAFVPWSRACSSSSILRLPIRRNEPLLSKPGRKRCISTSLCGLDHTRAEGSFSPSRV